MSAESEKAALKGFFERAKRRGLIEHDGAEMREIGIDPSTGHKANCRRARTAA